MLKQHSRKPPTTVKNFETKSPNTGGWEALLSLNPCRKRSASPNLSWENPTNMIREGNYVKTGGRKKN